MQKKIITLSPTAAILPYGVWFKPMCSGLSVSLYSWESGGLRFGFSSRRNLTAVDNPLAVLHLKNRLYFGTKKMHEGHGMKPPKKGKSRLFLKVQYLYNARIFPISVLHQPFLYFRTFSNIFKNILTALCRVYFIGLRNVGPRI